MVLDLRLGRRAMLGFGSAFLAAAAAPRAPGRAYSWHALGEDVRNEMRWAWREYRKHAWGKDQIKPISGGFESFPLKNHHLGLSLIEALDTLWVMGLDDEFRAGVEWVKHELDFDVDGEVSVFETSIRLVGGLLSAFHACGDPVLLAKARDCADRLLPSFAASPIGIPHRFVNLRTGALRGVETNPAETGTFIPEFGFLSRATGDDRYRKAAKRALISMFERRSKIGLLADSIDCMTGEWKSRRATIGPPSDSYYEYLWDGWDLLGDRDCLAMYRTCTAAILRHQPQRIGGSLWFVDVDFETGKRINWDQDELASFYGGLLGQGGAMREGAAYTRAWADVQMRYGVLPEEIDASTLKATSLTNSLRPELADAALNLWLLDRREEWRIVARDHYLAMKRWNKARYGYATLADVTATPKLQSDHCPGYWWTEQMKYYYLIFSDTPRFDYRRNYLSTEGNVLRGFRR
ncbi:MAG TPA: glycoside hydrolase family 47 protein [Sphingomicrobium sp.]|nr:glycoside hydrolase family 47 protein [Sphingomicrobium sp.]